VEVEPVVAAGGEDQELEGDLELGRRGVGTERSFNSASRGKYGNLWVEKDELLVEI